MFELQRLQEVAGAGIALQRRTGRDIRNVSGVELTERRLANYQLLLARYGQRWFQRRPPFGCYNCAGHVWASRRASIYEEADWRLILQDDGYRKTDEPVADDLAIYVEKQLGILHIGRVLELRPGIAEGSQRVPWIVSKWSDVSGEVCHHLHDHPLRQSGFVISVEFWSDR